MRKILKWLRSEPEVGSKQWYVECTLGVFLMGLNVYILYVGLYAIGKGV